MKNGAALCSNQYWGADLLLCTPAALGGLASAGWAYQLGAADWSALRFTILQAALSALLSTLSAVPLARAIARAQFWGRASVIRLMGVPFILPVIVTILGWIAVFGQNGWLNTGLRSLGFDGFSIYGLQGVLLAHVFFNLPLATRMILLD